MTKQSPSRWPQKPFKEVAEVVTGTTPPKASPEYYGGNVPFVTPSELCDDGRIAEAHTFLSDSGVKRARLLPVDSILVTCIGTLGKVGIAEQPLVTNQQINSLIFDSKIVFPKYAYFYCKTIQPILKTLAPATTVAIINKSKFSDIEIPLPPLPEQKRIAAILDKADAIRRKRRQAIKLADDFLRATFLDMFGDPVTNPKGWEVRPLKKLVSFRTGKLDSNAAVQGGRYPFFTCSRENFQIDTYAFDCEALLLAGNNAAGEYSVKYFKGKFNAYQRTYVITINGDILSYRYLQQALEMKLQDLKRMSKGTNTKYLTLGILNDLPFQIPSKGALLSYGNLVDKIEGKKTKLQNFAELAEMNFNSLTQRAFRGEL